MLCTACTIAWMNVDEWYRLEDWTLGRLYDRSDAWTSRCVLHANAHLHDCPSSQIVFLYVYVHGALACAHQTVMHMDAHEHDSMHAHTHTHTHTAHIANTHTHTQTHTHTTQIDSIERCTLNTQTFTHAQWHTHTP